VYPSKCHPHHSSALWSFFWSVSFVWRFLFAFFASFLGRQRPVAPFACCLQLILSPAFLRFLFGFRPAPLNQQWACQNVSFCLFNKATDAAFSFACSVHTHTHRHSLTHTRTCTPFLCVLPSSNILSNAKKGEKSERKCARVCCCGNNLWNNFGNVAASPHTHSRRQTHSPTHTVA